MTLYIMDNLSGAGPMQTDQSFERLDADRVLCRCNSVSIDYESRPVAIEYDAVPRVDMVGSFACAVLSDRLLNTLISFGFDAVIGHVFAGRKRSLLKQYKTVYTPRNDFVITRGSSGSLYRCCSECGWMWTWSTGDIRRAYIPRSSWGDRQVAIESCRGALIVTKSVMKELEKLNLKGVEVGEVDLLERDPVGHTLFGDPGWNEVFEQCVAGSPPPYLEMF